MRHPLAARAVALALGFAWAMFAAQALAHQDADALTPSSQHAERPRLPATVIDYFAGEWSGTGHFIKSGKPLASTFVFVPKLDRQAMLVRHTERAPGTFQYFGLMTMDSVTGDLVLLMASNHGAGGRVFRSKGWSGDTLSFTASPELQSFFARERITLTRQAETDSRPPTKCRRIRGKAGVLATSSSS